MLVVLYLEHSQGLMWIVKRFLIKIYKILKRNFNFQQELLC